MCSSFKNSTILRFLYFVECNVKSLISLIEILKSIHGIDVISILSLLMRLDIGS